jgi:hypothetical protein
MSSGPCEYSPVCGLILRCWYPYPSLLCSPLARVVSWGYCLLKLLNCSVYITVETRVYTQSSVFRSEVFLGKGFAVRVWAPFFLCFYPCGFWAWWQESSFSLWHRDPHLIHELNLCLSIQTGSIPIVVTVLSLEVGCCTRYASYLSPLDLYLI